MGLNLKKRTEAEPPKKSEPVEDLEQFSIEPDRVEVPTVPVKAFNPNEFGEFSEALSMELPILLEQASTLHGVMQRWTERVANLESEYLILKAGVDAQFGDAMLAARRDTESIIGKATKDTIEARARNDARYKELHLAMIEAQRDYQRAKGVVSALFAKRDMARAMLYIIGGENRTASETYTVDER